MSRGEAAAAATEKDLPSRLYSHLFSVFKKTQNPLVEITVIYSRNVTVGWLGTGQKRRLIVFSHSEYSLEWP